MKEYKGYYYKIGFDEYASSPDEWGDDEMFLVYDHRDFCVKRDGFDGFEIYEYLQGDKDYDFDDYFIFPIFAYIHSGVSLSLSHNGDPFDTSMRGFALISKELREDLTLELAQDYAEGLINDWNAYLSGQIFRYDIFKKEECDKCGNIEKIYVDSCGGYYNEEDCEKECKQLIDVLNEE